MLHVLEFFYSLPFVIGAVLGFCGQRCWAHGRARWLDRRHPLPDGDHRTAARVSQTWLAGLLAVVILGYVLLSSERTHEQAQRLTSDVTRCWAEAYQAAKARAELNDQDAKLTKEAGRYRNELLKANADWIRRLVNAPANIGDSIERRQQYMYDVTKVYAERYVQIMAQLDDVEARQDALERDREQHPLPEMTCGR